MLVTFGHNLSDFVSFLLFWRSGCQTLPWCQSRKCCEHYCDPVDCSDWRSGKKDPLTYLNLGFSFISLNHPCSVIKVVLNVSPLKKEKKVCTLTCSECILIRLAWVSRSILCGWRGETDYSPYGHHSRYKMCWGISPQGALIEHSYMHCTCVCTCDGRNRGLPSICFFVFFSRGRGGSSRSIKFSCIMEPCFDL